MKIPLQSKQFQLNKLPTSPLGKPCLLSLNFIYSDNNDYLARKTNLALPNHSSMPCRVHAIHIQYCWYPQYWIFWHTIFKQLYFLQKSIGFENSQSDGKHAKEEKFFEFLLNCAMQFWNYAPIKVLQCFGPPDIFLLQSCYSVFIVCRLFWQVNSVIERRISSACQLKRKSSLCGPILR